MNIVADDRISKTRDFTSEFALFPTTSNSKTAENSRLATIARPDGCIFKCEIRQCPRRTLFCSSGPTAGPAPEKHLAAGVLKQAAHDLRRFRWATKGLKQELYLDAYSWITDNDFSWPYSFVNVCKLLDVCPDVIRAELFADASLSWFDYWTKRAGRVSRRCAPLLSALSQAVTTRRAPRSTSWLHVFERMKRHCIRFVEWLRDTWRSLGNRSPESRSVPGIQHGFV